MKGDAQLWPKESQSWVSLGILRARLLEGVRKPAFHLRHFGGDEALCVVAGLEASERCACFEGGRKERHLRMLWPGSSIYYSLPLLLITRMCSNFPGLGEGGRAVGSDCVISKRRILGGQARAWLISSLLANFLHHFFCCVSPFVAENKNSPGQQHGGEETRTLNSCPVSVWIGFWVSMECRRRSPPLPCEWGF